MSGNISKIHLEILDNARREFFQKIIPVTGGFILGGGTALALQIRHRQSFDFDFFSASPIKGNLLEKFSRDTQISVTPLIDTSDELTVQTPDDIKLTFLFYPFEKAFGQVEDFNGLKLFSLPAIAAQKAYTIGRRGAYRDYFDIYSLLNQKYFTLDKIIENAANIFGDLFNEKLFLSQLVYFDDLTEFEITPIDPETGVDDADTVKGFLEIAVKDYVSSKTSY